MQTVFVARKHLLAIKLHCIKRFISILTQYIFYLKHSNTVEWEECLSVDSFNSSLETDRAGWIFAWDSQCLFGYDIYNKYSVQS